MQEQQHSAALPQEIIMPWKFLPLSAC